MDEKRISANALGAIGLCCLVAWSATCLAHANSAFRVIQSVEAGVLPLRKGPGVKHVMIAPIPAGDYVIGHRCGIQSDDGVSQSTWCLVRWGSQWGYVSELSIVGGEPGE